MIAWSISLIISIIICQLSPLQQINSELIKFEPWIRFCFLFVKSFRDVVRLLIAVVCPVSDVCNPDIEELRELSDVDIF